MGADGQQLFAGAFSPRVPRVVNHGMRRHLCGVSQHADNYGGHTRKYLDGSRLYSLALLHII